MTTSVSHPVVSTQRPAPEPSDQDPIRRTLNAMDCSILAVDAALKSMGSCGFDTQAIVMLRGRIDVRRLQATMDFLARKCPASNARLELGDTSRVPNWHFGERAGIRVGETTLSSADSQVVLDAASKLMAKQHDLTHEAPLRVEILHLPDERDVFVMQYNHVLMDNPGAIPLLREINRLYETPQHVVEEAHFERNDLIADYLSTIPRSRRWRSVLQAMKLRLWSLRGGIISVGNPRNESAQPLPVRFTRRQLDSEVVRGLTSRVAELCRFPGLSMALLGSVFRAIRPIIGERRGDRLAVGIGLELGLRSSHKPVFQNLSTVVPIEAKLCSLDPKEELVQSLNNQLRDRLAKRIDVGIVELSSVMRSRIGFVHWFIRRLMRYGYSMWYAYFGSIDSLGDAFCGIPIDDLFHAGPCWSSAGITLLASQYRGELSLTATYLPSCVPGEKVEQFMDALVDDLREWTHDRHP